MKDINKRFKQIRTELFHLTQESYGKMLGISKSGISEIESGRRNVTKRHILTLKNQGINVDWLVTGIGNMQIELDKKEELNRWVSTVFEKRTNTFQQRFVNMLMALNEEEWEWLESKANLLIKETCVDDDLNDTKEKNYIDINEEVEAYRQELESASKGGISSVSTTTSDTEEENTN